MFVSSGCRACGKTQYQSGRAIIKGKWKLVTIGGDDRWELFDRQQDKTETHDLSDAYPEVVSELKRLHAEWLAECAAQAES